MTQNTLRKLMLIAVLLTGSHAFAHDFEAQNSDGVTIYYNITSSADLTVEVTYNSANSYHKYKDDIVIPKTVEYNGTSYSVTNIGQLAFDNCASLLTITIPQSVISIGDYAFRSCYKLSSVVMPNSVKSIGVWAFWNCSGLTSVIIPESVTSIGDKAFYACTSLQSIVIPNSVTSIGTETFYKCESLTSLTIGNSVTSIGAKAFYYCGGLTSVTIPNSVISIGTNAFFNCYHLSSLLIGTSVTNIGSYAFYNCGNLTSVTIPNSVTNLDVSAFYLCVNLTEVICENVLPATAQSSTFGKLPTTATLYVPVGSKEAYANATGWNCFTNIVEMDTETGVESTLVDDVNVSVENGNIVISGADNANVEVYNVNGQCVYNGIVTTISVAAKGLYIVKVNDKSFKVML